MSLESLTKHIRHEVMKDLLEGLTYDGPMNDAAWAFIAFYNHDVPSHIFNNTKAGLIEAFKTYLEQKIVEEERQ